MQNNAKIHLFKKLNTFIKKFYFNQLIKGVIYSVAILIIFFIIFSVTEHFTKFNVGARTFLFWSYIIINGLIIIKYILVPGLRLLRIKKGLTHKDAAKIIGLHFNTIEDKLLNILELNEMSKTDNVLIQASIDQKIKSIQPIKFRSAINYRENQKHIKLILIPISIILLLIISGNKYILTESSARIIKHNTFFEPKAPFEYVILNPNLNVLQYNDYTLKFKLKGLALPEKIFIIINDQSFLIQEQKNNVFFHTFKSVNKNILFQFSAGGYTSRYYKITSLPQPKVVDLKILLDYPNYTLINDNVINNNGNIIIPEGTLVNWQVTVENSNKVTLSLPSLNEEKNTTKKFNYKKHFYNDTKYQIITTNKHDLTDSLAYFIKIIPDKHPSIKVTQKFDSTNTQFVFNGEIQDDYCLKKLFFNYHVLNNDTNYLAHKEITIKKLSKELFFFTFSFDELNLSPEAQVKYYFQVWDNDGVNGSKSTKSMHFKYVEKSKEKLITIKDNENNATKKSFNTSISIAKEIQKDIAQLKKSILEKKEVSWEERQKAKEIIKKQKKLEKQIKQTQQKNSLNLKKKEKLNSSTLEKQKKLDDLIKSLLDEKTKKLLKEIEEKMFKANKEKLKELLDKLDKQNLDLEKELERDLELFKQLEFEQKLEEVVKKIKKIKEEQEKLKIETEKNKTNKEELSKNQEELIKKMAKLENELKNLRDKNLNLEKPNNLPDTQSKEKTIKEKMSESQKALNKGTKNKSKNAQKDAIQKLKELEKQMLSFQQNNAQEKPQEDIETLRKILENLITLSFDQEDLITTSENTPINSSKFVKIVQKQNKLADDSKIIQDSLLALSKRVVQIESIINKEISSINNNMKKATKTLEERQVQKAVKQQQFVMTSTNNLALLLSEILEQMQKDLEMSANQCNKPRNCNKTNPNCNKPSSKELKKAQEKLNNKIKKGKRKGEGEKSAKELMELAKMQETIRQQLIDLRNEKNKSGEKDKIDKILKDMEKNETDIINNQITQKTIERQKRILTRLLESEQSEREEKEDNKREANEWLFNIENSNKEYLKYKKRKEKQEEMLRTTPIQLTPYYKKKVDSYFNSLMNDIQ